MEPNAKNEEKNQSRRYFGIPKQGLGFILLAVVLSFLLHIGSYINLNYIAKHYMTMGEIPSQKMSMQKPITMKIQNKPKKARDKEQEPQRIVEAPMAPTEKPTVPRFRGAQDHRAEKEMKVSQQRERPKAKDPGQGKKGGTLVMSGPPSLSEPPKEMLKERKKSDTKQDKKQEASKPVTIGDRKVKSSNGEMKVQAGERKPRNKFEELIPTSSELAQIIKEGYQDYIDEEIEEGDRIDINTSDYRFIGYFTALRKAFELVWTYPPEAIRRGLDGEVVVQFTILKDGSVRKIKILKKSGHEILDSAVVNAIQLASPYSPLPDGMGKDKLTVSGSFRYVLSNYAGGH